MSEKSLSHCQGKGSLTHNNRTFVAKNVDKTRIRDNITFVNKPIDEVYHEIFDKAVEEYNSRQKRKDRRIDTGYFEYQFGRPPTANVVTSPDKRNSFYEDVVQIGCKDDTAVGTADAEIAKECLVEYMNGFKERNPNFVVFNAVLHMDEATPHLHIDYIPIGHYKRGVPIQNGIAQALKEMGYGNGKDSIARWRKAECTVLQDIAERHGISIRAPEKSRGSTSVEDYKEYVRLKEEMETLREMEIAADDTELPGRRTLTGKYVLSDEDYQQFMEEKQALAAKETEAEHIIQTYEQKCAVFDDKKAQLDKREDSIAVKEQEAEKYAKERTIMADSMMNRAKKMYEEQHDLNKRYDFLEQERDSLQWKVDELQSDNRKMDEMLIDKTQELEKVRDEMKQMQKKSDDTHNDDQQRIRTLERDSAVKNSKISDLEQTISLKDKEIEEKDKRISFWKRLYEKAIEVGQYICKIFRLRYDFEKCVEMRNEDYRLNYIFGDDERTR